MITKNPDGEGGNQVVMSSFIGMGNDQHFTPDRLLDQMERCPEAVVRHSEVCEACRYVLALVRRASGEPSPEQSEVVVDLLRKWSGQHVVPLAWHDRKT
jgi:hypothetical protein